MIRDKGGKAIKLRAVRPNVGIQAAYRRKLLSLIAEMQASYVWWLRAQFRETPPRMAKDETPANALRRELKKLGIRWERQFEEAAPKLAEFLAKSAANRSDAALRAILRKGGFSVRFQITPAMRDVMGATINENVALVKSIASEYHTQVEGLVMRSVTEGRNLSFLSKELQTRYGITRRRAEFISRDQNNKATAMLSRARHLEIGLDDATWLHSGGGRQPRPTHVKNSGKKFSLRDGWLDPALSKRIWPGTEPNCRCVFSPIVKGFS